MTTVRLGEGTGPLRGVRVVEIAGIGPGPHACMILADLGADVIRIDRPGGGLFAAGADDLLARGRPSVALDLKHEDGAATVLDLVATADILIEGLRPGTTERLGLGPEVCFERNPALVYGRMTGWGQTGPVATTAGHDLTYLAVAGVLDGLGQDPARPHFPGNLLGDFGGGSTYLVIGVLAALLEARLSGRGQVVDAAIVEGVAHLNTMGAMLRAAGLGGRGRAAGLLDGGAPYYDVYETADGRHLAVAALEPRFYEELLDGLGLSGQVPDRDDPASYAELRVAFATRIAQRPLTEWVAVFEGSDACVAPSLTLEEAAAHPQLRERQTFTEVDGRLQPAPAPRFSRTTPSLTMPPAAAPGEHTRAALAAWGITDVDGLVARGVAIQV